MPDSATRQRPGPRLWLAWIAANGFSYLLAGSLVLLGARAGIVGVLPLAVVAFALVAAIQGFVLHSYFAGIGVRAWVRATTAGFLGAAAVLALVGGGTIFCMLAGSRNGAPADYMPYSMSILLGWLLMAALIMVPVALWGGTAYKQAALLAALTRNATLARNWIAGNVVAVGLAAVAGLIWAGTVIQATRQSIDFAAAAPAVAVYCLLTGLLIGAITGRALANLPDQAVPQFPALQP